MPAHPKYLTTSRWQRFAKITAAILGGYFVSMSLHLALAAWCNHVIVLMTSTFSGFLVWVTLMIFAFLKRNGWHTWLHYLLLTAIFTAIALWGKNANPHFLHLFPG